MNIGDKITFTFAKEKREGIVQTIYGNNVLIQVDFERHKNKLIHRKLYEVDHSSQKKKAGK